MAKNANKAVMNNPKTRFSSVKFATKGHKEILNSICQKFGIKNARIFIRNHTACCIASLKDENEVFIKVKGYEKIERNIASFKRAIDANKLACCIKDPMLPRIIEYRAFERNNLLWLTSVSVYGGEPISKGMFFDADPDLIKEEAIKRLHHIIGVIQKSPAPKLFYDPRKISLMITDEFGNEVPNLAPVWTSAHCDLHWGNVLTGAEKIVDWDMFSLAPKGFDTASILLFSSNKPDLFARLLGELKDDVADISGKTATFFAAARLLRLMKLKEFEYLKEYDSCVREAVERIVS